MPRRLVHPPSLLCAFVLLFAAWNSPAQSAPPSQGEPLLQESEMVKLPTGVLLIKGTEATASDSVTPLPESGRVVKDVYQNPYFGLAYPLPADWSENFAGPPPSDSGTYVLALVGPSTKFKGPSRATLLIQAHDLFFSPSAAANAMELVEFAKERLEPIYEIEKGPEVVKIAHRSFIRYGYKSEAAGLHWVVLTTEIRCHAVQFIFTSSDVELLEALIKDMNRMKLPPEAAGGEGDLPPLCIAGYGEGSSLLNRVPPVMTGSQKFNPIPVRIIIDKRGRVRHIHMINAFPEQAASIQDALLQWTFKPREQNGQRVEVETGILFGYAPPWPKRAKGSAEPQADQ
jgi:hypothetical protein